ncbi:MAG: rod shape-determining protein MreC [Bacteroidales bacterium]|nr:rod shape-determining protein MreC [Bacteroidales bacterium]
MVDERKIWARVISTVIFILMELAALSMLKHSGSLQDIWISKASHRVMAWVWGGFDSIGRYFSLRNENEKLAEENAMLTEELRRSRDRVQTAMENGLLNDTTVIFSGYEHVPASIVKISRNKQHNYFILNKGYEDGVRPQSGVITPLGIVGIVDAVEKHYSYGLSFMNTGVSVSARLGNEGAVGPLTWDGISMDGAVLKDIPLQYKYAPGDTVWTSGDSILFPPDIPLGIAGSSKVVNGAVNEIQVDLFQSFTALRYVTVVSNSGREEIMYLENLEKEGEEKQ